MVGKKSGKALREEGLERTDNHLDLTTWPVVAPINQKNYYTEYLKRDDQILPLRLLQEERRNKMATNAKDKDRALAQNKSTEDADMEVDDEGGMEEEGTATQEEALARSKFIVIHPGSQNLRIGFGTDALPKTVPMVVARKWICSESQENGGEPSPKRAKLDDGSIAEPEEMFSSEFTHHYNAMCSDLKVHMRANKRRVLPNSKELVVNFNRRSPAETISEHNDPLRIEWTEIGTTPSKAPDFVTGKEALRIPDSSNPPYKLFWPLRNGWYNEREYDKKASLNNDISVIIEEAIKKELGLPRRREWLQYACVFVIPDLYDRNYVIEILEMMMRDFGFSRVCFIQESLAATFGAGFTSACVVDIGAQKISICCVDEGMCVENSRVNIKYGGYDVTETFMRMMLTDQFPYQDLNLKRRYDFLLAEELKMKHCTMNENEISVQLYDFHVRAPGQDTKKWSFKTYDEVLLAPAGFFQPAIFDNSKKLTGRRKLFEASRDLYDNSSSDPISSAQAEILQLVSPITATEKDASTKETPADTNGVAIPLRQPPNPLSRLAETDIAPNSAMGTPAPEGDDSVAIDGTNKDIPTTSSLALRDDVLPIVGLDIAILTSIMHGAKNDEKKLQNYLGGVILIGGGAKIAGLHSFLEERLMSKRPDLAKQIMVGTAPRELDPQCVMWKGASIFGKLRSANDSWIGRLEYDRLGARTLAYRCMWPW